MGRRIAIWLFLLGLLLTGCTQDSPSQAGALRDATPVVYTPSHSDTPLAENSYGAIDASHLDQGYFMAEYFGSCEKVRLQVLSPGGGETYTYAMTPGAGWETFPLTEGDGTYTVRLLENVEGNSYAISLTATLEVSLSDEFLPFLYPNQFVAFSEDSAVVALSETLAQDATSDLEVVTSVYHYVTETISYDTQKAESVEYGYIPNLEEILSTQKGICFDYAALMTALLRLQRIPTRLEVGYAGDVYHAWISTYIPEVGWLDHIIEFDGESWQILDPTLAASNTSSTVGTETNYIVKYNY